MVCSYNGAETIDETLTALTRLNYPDYEVIVVDDGSTDATAEIARKHDVSLIQSENKGLSNARNLGMEAATGEIIAYIDDDAYPDPDWLKFLAASFMRYRSRWDRWTEYCASRRRIDRGWRGSRAGWAGSCPPVR